ncbi:hypothetical protein AMTRI_Chr07g25410 [Amborella trichopoda]
MINLQSMEISSNKFGKIQEFMDSLQYLQSLNLSFNRLSGDIPSSQMFVNVTADTFWGTPLLCGPPKLRLRNQCYNIIIALRITDSALHIRKQMWISYYELHRATDNFNDSNLLGISSFGSVYKGIPSDDTPTAIKVFNLPREGASKSFDSESKVLRKIRHRNLVKVITAYSNLDFKALVFRFMAKGNLDEQLHPQDEA